MNRKCIKVNSEMKRSDLIFFKICEPLAGCILVFISVFLPFAAQGQQYDLLIKGGHVIDPKNEINSPMDVGIANGIISRVAPNISNTNALQIVDATGYYVTPGLIDAHAHVFVGSTPGRFADGFSSVSPDEFTFRNGITTVVDPGTAGWRNFEAFKTQVIDPSHTRVLAFINIVGHGLYGTSYNNDLEDMDPEKTVDVIEAYPDIIVGVKFGHYAGADYLDPFERSMEAARRVEQPLLLECNLPELDVEDILQRMRPGDIFTHAYETGNRSLLDEEGSVYDYVFEARDRGVLFDVGHGGASFRFRQAIPSVKQGLLPDTFGTDLHRFSMNAGMKDLLNVMSKFLNMGISIQDVILRATWNSARSVKREDIGHLSEGAAADLAILNKKKGSYGFVDSDGYRMDGSYKLEAELTLREGRVVWDLNGLSAPSWDE